MRRILICLSAFALCLGSSGWCRAAEPAGATSFIPSDAAVVMVARVKKGMDAKMLEPILKEAAIADQLKQSPLDPRKIEEIILAVSPTSRDQTPAVPSLTPAAPAPGAAAAAVKTVAIVLFTEPMVGKDLLTKIAPTANFNFDTRTHQGKTYYASAAPSMFLAQLDDKTVAISSQEDAVKDVLAGTTAKGPIAEKLRVAGRTDDILVVVLMEPLRDPITQARARVPARATANVPMFNELAGLSDQIKSATLTLSLSSRQPGHGKPRVQQRRGRAESERHAQEGPRRRQAAGGNGRDGAPLLGRHDPGRQGRHRGGLAVP